MVRLGRCFRAVDDQQALFGRSPPRILLAKAIACKYMAASTLDAVCCAMLRLFRIVTELMQCLQLPALFCATFCWEDMLWRFSKVSPGGDARRPLQCLYNAGLM